MFVATPLYVWTAQAGVQGVDRQLEHASATHGTRRQRSSFGSRCLWPCLPLERGDDRLRWAPGGQFGAAIAFASNAVGLTRTMPLPICQALETHLNVCLTTAAILAVVSLALLVVRTVSRLPERQ